MILIRRSHERLIFTIEIIHLEWRSWYQNRTPFFPLPHIHEWYHIRILYYNYVIMSAMASQITSLTPAFIQAQIKETIKALRQWLLWGEFTGDRWIPLTKGQWRGKCFHLMTSSWSRIQTNFTLKGPTDNKSGKVLGNCAIIGTDDSLVHWIIHMSLGLYGLIDIAQRYIYIYIPLKEEAWNTGVTHRHKTDRSS